MRRSLLAIVTTLQVLGHPAAAQHATAIARLDHPPVVDGTLSDSAWRQATLFTGFKTLHPEAGKEPTESTEVYLAYDRDNLYVGVRSFDRRPDSIVSSAVTPDDAWHGDWVAFCLDAQNQGLDALFFLVTPAGYQVAGVLGFDGGPVQVARRDWSSAVRRTSDGYTAEMAIPFAQLPYRSGDTVEMAFKLARRIGRSGEEMDFPEIDPDRPHINQLQRIALTGVASSTVPYGRPLFDARAAYGEKVNRLERSGDSTMDERVAAWGDASVFDALIFPARTLTPSTRPFRYPRRLETDSVAARFAHLEYLPGRPISDVAAFLGRTQTTSLIVIHDDTVVYEQYFNGWGPDSIFTSFSVAKAFVSTLVGIAIDRGLIRSVTDTITRYLPELRRRDPRFDRITIRDLLRMASGLRYVEDQEPYDNRWTYLAPDLRRSARERSTIVEEPGRRWLYNNYNPLLIGMILERVTHRTVTELLQRWIWDPLGTQYGGSWSIDSRADGFEKMESGINARPVDFAKLGSLFLHDGEWNGQRVVSAGWVHDATQPWPDPPGYYEDQGFFGPGGHFFGYFWWGDSRSGGPSDFHTVGNKGQFIYCSPQKHLVIVRTGMEYGVSSSTWLRLFRQVANQFDDLALAPSQRSEAREYWPSHQWRRSTPEAQGMDSRVLADALDYIDQHQIPIHSLVIVRNGYLILDAYFWPFQDHQLHDLASVTKSVTSTLAGVAIGEHKLNGLQQPVLPLFTREISGNRDERKNRLTIEHLLTMTSGLDCHAEGGEVTLSQMMASPDWVRFMVELPMVAEPGTRFEYCSGGMHLLSSIITRATGMSALHFAQRELFGPLGIENVVWPADPQGNSHGWGDLHLEPRDMAKIGYLWLRGGRWGNRQLVPTDWMRAAVQVHAQPGFSAGQDYGFGIWVYPDRTPPEFEGLGRGGQRISVIPAKDLVVVFTGGEFEPGDIGGFIGRAIKSDGPLPADSVSSARLAAALRNATRPPGAHATPSLPPVAQFVSGRPYALGANPLDLRSFTVTFPGGAEARLELQLRDRRDGPRPVGLDGIPRVSPDGRYGLPVAVSGAWENDSTFVLDYDEVGNIDVYHFRLVFVGHDVVVSFSERSGALRRAQFRGTSDPR